jgi:hypothetical protein
MEKNNRRAVLGTFVDVPNVEEPRIDLLEARERRVGSRSNRRYVGRRRGLGAGSTEHAELRGGERYRRVAHETTPVLIDCFKTFDGVHGSSSLMYWFFR